MHNGDRDHRDRVLLVADADYWAFAASARHIEHYLADDFAIDVVYSFNVRNFCQLARMMQGYALVHFFWRPDLLNLMQNHWFGQLNMSNAGAKRPAGLQDIAVSSAVFDHLVLEPENIAAYSHMYQNIDGYSTCSIRLFDIYSKIPAYPKPDAILSDGVDTTLFAPANLERLSDGHHPLTIGWVGNSNWGQGFSEDHKGLHTILRPAIELLKSRNINVNLILADRAERMIPNEEMPSFYQKLDLLMCASLSEGTPMPVLEALCCGVPVVSTDVGIVPEALLGKQAEFIVKERTVANFAAAIERLHVERHLLQVLSQQNLSVRADWDWRKKAEDYRHFFKSVLARKFNRQGGDTAID